MPACPLNSFFSHAQRARYLGAIPHRYSCRSFSEPLDISHISALSYAAQRVCLPSVRIVISECTDDLFFGLPIVGRIKGMTRCAYIIADMNEPRAALHAGISGEAFILEAAAMQVGTCWVSGSYRRSAVDVDLEEGEKILAVTPLGIPKDKENPPVRSRKKLSQICLGNPTDWPLWAYHAAEAVRAAPSAVNMQPWKLSYSGHALQLSTGSKVNSLDLGIAMLHMEAAMEGRKHLWEWGEGKTVAHLIVEENE